MCLLTGTVPPKRCPCPKAAPEPEHLVLTPLYQNDGDRGTNHRLPASQLVFQSFRSTTPALQYSEPNKSCSLKTNFQKPPVSLYPEHSEMLMSNLSATS